MKKTIILLFCFIHSFIFSQSIITVQGENSETSFHTTMEQAYEASVDGDTIFVSAGNFPIDNSGFEIDKAIHIIGNGFDPDSSFAGPSYLPGTMFLLSGANGGSIQGIQLSSLITGSSDSPIAIINNYFISRCKISIVDLKPISFEESDISGFTIFQSLIGRIVGDYSSNVIIRNSILNDFGPTNANSSTFGLTQNILVENSLLIINNIGGFQNTTFRNCMYYQRSSQNLVGFWNGVSVYNCIIDATNTNISDDWMDYIEIGSGNFSADFTSDMFLNFDDIDLLDSYFESDLQLHPNSPAIGAGENGTDIGIYGGDTPWKDGALPSIPSVRSLYITPSTNSNGGLIINAVVTGQEN